MFRSSLAASSAVVLALACHAPAPEVREQSVEQEVAALVERTNALRSFHAVYDVEQSDAASMTLDFVYRAPDLARARMVAGDDIVEC